MLASLFSLRPALTQERSLGWGGTLCAPHQYEWARAPRSVSRPVTKSRGTHEAFCTGAEEAGQHFEGCMTLTT